MKKIIKPLSLLMSTFLLFGCSFGKAIDLDESNKPQEQQKEDEPYQPEPSPINIWGCYGSLYSSYLNNIVTSIGEKTDANLLFKSQGSCPGLDNALSLAYANNQCPDLAIQDFAYYVNLYARSNLKPYDSYLNPSELNDYYDHCLINNFYGYKNGQKNLYALPFGASTEVLAYNGVFVDYCATINPSLATLPRTWQEWESKGESYLSIYNGLVNGHKLIYGKQTPDGTAYDFVVTSPGEQAPYSSSLLLDFSEVSSNDIYLLTYDNSSDAFITLLKQWGSNAVEVSQSDLIIDLRRRKGHIVFNSEINRQKTIECLTFFEKLNTEKLFGLPINFNSGLVVDAFTKNKTMFSVITSGSASFFSNDSNKRVRFAPIPYFDNGVEIRKFAAFNETGVLTFNKSNQENAIEIAKSLTSGENQARWCIDTGYIPTTKSATFSPNYQNFINGSNYDDLTNVYKRESNQVYQNTYMNLSNNWSLYVNDIFMSYMNVYDEFGSILEKVFSYGKTEEQIHQILQDTLKEYNNITDVVID